MTYRGKVEHGVVVLDPGVELPEGAQVTVEFEPKEAPAGDQSVDPLVNMSRLAVETGIRDLATNIDHYLYGHPKASDAG